MHLVAGPLHLSIGPGELHRAALGPVTVDALVRRDLADLVDRLLHRPVHRDGRLPAGHPLQLRQRSWEERRAPATVAPGRAEAGDLALAEHDPQPRVRRTQVVRGPHTGQAGPGDRDVGLGIAIQARSRLK